MKTLASLALVIALVAAPGARAQEREQPSKWGSVELGAGPFVPNLDRGVSSGHTPYADIFGGSPSPMFRVHIGKAIFSRVGTLELGIKTGFWSKSGRALDDQRHRTGDRTSINVFPTSLTLTYRADFVWEEAHVPLVPYGRVALERYNWWTTKDNKWSKSGATNGYSGTVGLVLILDWLDPDLAREAESDVGIAHTGLYFDVTKSKVKDFGSKKSWDMSEKDKLFWSAGLLISF